MKKDKVVSISTFETGATIGEETSSYIDVSYERVLTPQVWI